MMNSILRAVPGMLCILGLLCPGISFSQSADYLAPRIGLAGRFGLLSGSVASSVDSDPSYDLRGTFFGLGGEFAFPLVANGRLGVAARFLYLQEREYLDAARPGFALRDGDAARWSLVFSDRLDFVNESVRLEALVDLRIGGGFYFRCGPSLAYRVTAAVPRYVDGVIAKNEDGTIVLLQSGGANMAITPTGVRVQVEDHWVRIPEDETVAASSIAAGGVAAVSCEIPIGGGFLLAPEIIGQWSPSPQFVGRGEQAYGLGFGVSLLRGFGNGKTAPPEIPPPGPSPPDISEIVPSDAEVVPALSASPDPVPLTAAITVRGVDRNDSIISYARVGLYEILERDSAKDSWKVRQDIVQPVLLLDPSYSAAAKSWRLLFLYGDSVVATTSSDDATPLTRFDWRAAFAVDSALPLVVELTAIDSAGASVTVSDQILLKVARGVRIVDRNGAGVLYTLYPEEGMSRELTPENREVLKEIAVEAEGNSRIFLSGIASDVAGAERSALRNERLRQAALALRQLLDEQGKTDVRVTLSAEKLRSEYQDAELPDERIVRPEMEIVLLRN